MRKLALEWGIVLVQKLACEWVLAWGIAWACVLLAWRWALVLAFAEEIELALVLARE